MKHIFSCLMAFTLLAASPLHAESSEKIVFSGETYLAAWSDVDGSIREFVRSSETKENWTKLISIRWFKDLSNPMQAVTQLQATLNAQNPGAHSKVIENPNTGEVLIDFTTWSDDTPYIEFNVFKYLRNPSGPGLVAYQYAVRDSGEPEVFFQKLRKMRGHAINKMSEATFLKQANK